MTFLDQIARTPITREQIREADEAICRHHELSGTKASQRGLDISLMILLRDQRMDREIVMAIVARMEAFVGLLKRGEVGDWASPDPTDPSATLTSDATLEAIAITPLHCGGSSWMFDAEAFRHAALAAAEPEGTA